MHGRVLNLAVCIALSITRKQRNSTVLMLTDQYKAKSGAAVTVFSGQAASLPAVFSFSRNLISISSRPQHLFRLDERSKQTGRFVVN